jgi:hypothetical protein
LRRAIRRHQIAIGPMLENKPSRLWPRWLLNKPSAQVF